MSRKGALPRRDEDPPPRSASLYPSLESSTRPPSPSKSTSRTRAVNALFFEESEWSPPVPRALAKDMPILPDRFSWHMKPSKPVDPAQHSVWLFDNTAFRLEWYVSFYSILSLHSPAYPYTIQPTPVQSNSNSVQDETKRYPHQKSSHSFIDPNLEGKDPSPPPRWQAEFVAAYFAEKLDHDPTLVAKGVCKKLGIKEDDSAIETIKRRVEPFVTPILPRCTIRVKIDNIETQTLGPASSFGISSSVNRLHFEPPTNAHQTYTTAAVPTSSPNFILPSTTVFAEPEGWAVISDIDDTIKITATTSPLGILKTTFVDTPQPVEGMPELYSTLNTRLAQPAWFYLSASPYTLYPFLREFRIQHYPHGTIILRDASWQNLGGLISSLVLNVQEYKVNRMMKLHGWFPRRKLICIGDSTQKDPESYAEIARRFPGWVKAIFIRKVVDVGRSGLEEEEKNGAERFERAFLGLGDKGCFCFVFEHASEVEGLIAKVLGG